MSSASTRDGAGEKAVQPACKDMFAFYRSHRLIVAPMAGVTDKVFRQLCYEQGAQLAFTEMVSAKGLSYANEKTAHLVDLGEDEVEVGVQLFGHEPSTMAQEAAWLEQHLQGKLAVIDVNMGCPARKIVTKGDGSALMEQPDLAARIVRAIADAVETPVTVKMRRGFAEGDETAPAFAFRMEQAGASSVTVHGRFAKQLYRGLSDRGVVSRVKQAVSIPVVGNGDIASGADACAMMAQTKCDAVMVGRASRGNPWIFAECAAALAGDAVCAPPSFEERLALAKRHVRMLDAAYDGRVIRMRKDAMWYLAGMPGAARARRLITSCSTCDDFCSLFDAIGEDLKAREASGDKEEMR